MALPKRQETILEKSIRSELPDKAQKDFDRVEGRHRKEAKIKKINRLTRFRKKAEKMSMLELFQEKHNSFRLGNLMRAEGMARPAPMWEAHHIVSGGHREAEETRTILADDAVKLRIDDPDNGCWMPKQRKHAYGTIYPHAIGHNRIHRQKYYDWLNGKLAPIVAHSNPYFQPKPSPLAGANVNPLFQPPSQQKPELEPPLLNNTAGLIAATLRTVRAQLLHGNLDNSLLLSEIVSEEIIAIGK